MSYLENVTILSLYQKPTMQNSYTLKHLVLNFNQIFPEVRDGMKCKNYAYTLKSAHICQSHHKIMTYTFQVN